MNKSKTMRLMNPQFWVARQRSGLSQQAIADKAGLAQGDISRIEKGGWCPPPDVQQRLAEALGVPLEVIFPVRREVAS